MILVAVIAEITQLTLFIETVVDVEFTIVLAAKVMVNSGLLKV